jgi:hypothetical protein
MPCPYPSRLALHDHYHSQCPAPIILVLRYTTERREFFVPLCEFMVSGPVVALEIVGAGAIAKVSVVDVLCLQQINRVHTHLRFAASDLPA